MESVTACEAHPSAMDYQAGCQPASKSTTQAKEASSVKERLGRGICRLSFVLSGAGAGSAGRCSHARARMHAGKQAQAVSIAEPTSQLACLACLLVRPISSLQKRPCPTLPKCLSTYHLPHTSHKSCVCLAMDGGPCEIVVLDKKPPAPRRACVRACQFGFLDSR